MKLDIKYNGVDFVKYYIKTNNFLKEELKNGTIKKITMILKAKYTEKEVDIIFDEELFFVLKTSDRLGENYQYEYSIVLEYSEEKSVQLLTGNMFVDTGVRTHSEYVIDVTKNIAKLYHNKITDDETENPKPDWFVPDFVARFILAQQ